MENGNTSTATFLQIDLQSLFVSNPQKNFERKPVFHEYDQRFSRENQYKKGHEFFNRERLSEERQEHFNRESRTSKDASTKNEPKRMDFDKVWTYFNSRETEFLTQAIIYTIKNVDRVDPDYYDRFETKIKSIGFKLKVKSVPKLSKRYGISQIVPITIDCVSRAELFDKWILMTNNNKEFIDLCKYVKGIGKKIELWSFKENYDPILEPYTDKMHFIEDSFCLKGLDVFVFGISWGGEEILSSIEKNPLIGNLEDYEHTMETDGRLLTQSESNARNARLIVSDSTAIKRI